MLKLDAVNTFSAFTHPALRGGAAPSLTFQMRKLKHGEVTRGRAGMQTQAVWFLTVLKNLTEEWETHCELLSTG